MNKWYCFSIKNANLLATAVTLMEIYDISLLARVLAHLE